MSPEFILLFHKWLRQKTLFDQGQILSHLFLLSLHVQRVRKHPLHGSVVNRDMRIAQADARSKAYMQRPRKEQVWKQENFLSQVGVQLILLKFFCITGYVALPIGF